MKRIAWLLIKEFILVLTVVILVAGVAACSKSTPTTYELTHSAADAEYILSWDSIVSRCPDIGAYDKQEVFIRRGETKQISSGEPSTTSTLEMDSPAAWGSIRVVQTAPAGEKVRGFGVWICFMNLMNILTSI